VSVNILQEVTENNCTSDSSY